MVALHPNFDTIAVRVQNGCSRVQPGAFCAGFYTNAEDTTDFVLVSFLRRKQKGLKDA